GTTTRIGITTLHDAAAFAGIPLGAPTDVYKPATAALPDVALAVDAGAAKALADWYALGAAGIDKGLETDSAYDPNRRTIWPEHFDLAAEMGDKPASTRANYGASPGDTSISEPYLYVGPWDEARRTGRLGEHPWGASITYSELAAASDARTAGID